MQKSSTHTLFIGVMSGLVAGLVFLSIAMISGATATSPWAMPEAIAHVLGMAAPVGYAFAAGALLVGIIVHLTFSIVLGVLFTAFARWRRLRGWTLVLAGFLLMMLETPIALWVVLHNTLPASAFTYLLGSIPLWGSVAGRCMFGLVLGLLLARFAPWQASAPASPLAGERLHAESVSGNR